MTEKTVDSPTPISEPAAKIASGGRGVVGALLMTTALLAALAAVVYVYAWPWLTDQWQRLAQIEQQLVDVSLQEQQIADRQGQLLERIEDDVQTAVAAGRQEWERKLTTSETRQRVEQAASARQFADRMGRLESQVDRLLEVDRRAWLGQEAIFLIRLAAQRLLIARDVAAAINLLTQADALLRETGEPTLEGVRADIARDRAALAALPKVDQVGLYARLSALIDQAEQLQLAYEIPMASEVADPVVSGWWDRAAAGWRAALTTLSDHLVIRRRSDEIAQLMTPEWASLARQNMRMLLEQAQIAMLSANQPLFETALQRAARFAELFADQDPDRVASIMADIQVMASENIAPELPDLAPTRSRLETAIARLAGPTGPQ
jgi:uroporphyrin-3 C-methyltransferase